MIFAYRFYILDVSKMSNKKMVEEPIDVLTLNIYLFICLFMLERYIYSEKERQRERSFTH